MTSKYTPEEINLMTEILFINLIKENKLTSEDIAHFAPRLLELYLDNVDTSLNNNKFRYEIKRSLLTYFISSNNLEKIIIFKKFLNSYIYYSVFDSLHQSNIPLNLSNDLIKFLNIK